MNSVISINNISKAFGSKKVLENISFDLYENEIIGLVGLNGAGKSTLISIILGLLKSDDGLVNLNSKKVGAILQEVSMPAQIKVYEFIEMVMKFAVNPKSLEEVLEISDLQNEHNSFCDKLSGGQQRRLQFALAIASNPKVLILDEPTVGMDFKSKEKFLKYLKEVSTTTSIILSSHDFSEIQTVATRVVVLNKAQIIYDKKAEDIEYSKVLKIGLNKIDLSILENKEVELSKYEVQGKDVLIYSSDMKLLIRQLSGFGISFDDFEITNTKLENIINIIINSEVCYE